MSLRAKSLLVASGTMAILIILLFVSARIIVTDSYTRLEEQNIREHVGRAVNALTNDLATLQRTAHDYASWDDTYNFMQDHTPGYIEDNFVDATLVNNHLSLIMLISPQGDIVYTKAFDLSRSQEISASKNLGTLVLQSEVLLRPMQMVSPTVGILMLPEGPLLIADRPILTSLEAGPIHGALIMGRALTLDEVNQLSEITQLKLDIQVLNETLPPEAQAARAALSDQQPIVVRPASEQLVQGYTLIKDINGQPALLLRIDRARDIYQQGQQTLTYLVVTLLIAGLIAGVMQTALLQRTVINRLSRLNREVRDIGGSGNLALRVSTQSRDEIGNLSTEINHTLEALETAQRSLRQREREALTLLDSIPAFAFFKDAQGHYVVVNQRFCEALHRTREAMVGTTDYDFYPPERAAHYQADDDLVMQQGEPHEVGEETFGSGPDAIVLATRKVPLKDDRGKVIGLIGLSFDVTDRKRAAQELAIARDQAVEALRFKSQLLAHVSHDLRTPINAILGYTEMLQAEVYGQASEQQSEPLARIIVSCHQLTRLVNDLLIQSRMEAGKLVLANRSFALSGLMESIKAIASSSAQEKQLELVCRIEPDVPVEVEGDVERLHQIVLNLVDNAIKFTEHGSISVRIFRPDDGHYAITVSDTGQGILPEEQTRVFEAFQQGSLPATGSYKGVGLGLSIVQQLTLLMSGQVSLSSQVGQGSQFTITLPLVMPPGEKV